MYLILDKPTPSTYLFGTSSPYYPAHTSVHITPRPRPLLVLVQPVHSTHSTHSNHSGGGREGQWTEGDGDGESGAGEGKAKGSHIPRQNKEDQSGQWSAGRVVFSGLPSEESEKVGYNGLDVTMDNQQVVQLTV